MTTPIKMKSDIAFPRRLLFDAHTSHCSKNPFFVQKFKRWNNNNFGRFRCQNLDFWHQKLPKIHFLGWLTFYRFWYKKIKIDFCQNLLFWQKLDFEHSVWIWWDFGKNDEFWQTAFAILPSFLKVTNFLAIGKKKSRSSFLQSKQDSIRVNRRVKSHHLHLDLL